MTDDAFHRTLAENARLPYVAPDALSAIRTDAFAADAARRFDAVPIADDGETLHLATADPATLDTEAAAALAGRTIRVVVSPPAAVARELTRLGEGTTPEPAPKMRAMPSFKRAFRGYRRDEVDRFAADAVTAAGRMQQELDAASARSQAMAVEIRELHARVDQLREREAAVSRALDEMREQREQFEREARRQAQELVQEAQERAMLLKTEGIRQVGELQAQVEQLIGMRAGLTQALQRLSEDLAGAMARLASSPATAIDRPIEHHLERWSEPDRPR
jgi:cell division septum initiation protein DivIVA